MVSLSDCGWEPTTAGDGERSVAGTGPLSVRRQHSPLGPTATGLLSDPDGTERDSGGVQSTGTPLLSDTQRRNRGPPPPINTRSSGGVDTRGRLLSLIDGVYQQNLDTDANTTFITPLDRVGREPFELSVHRYSRFVEGQAKQRGQTPADEDLEDLLQRLKGRLESGGPERGQADGRSEGFDGGAGDSPVKVRTVDPLVDRQHTVGSAVDPDLTNPLVLFDADAAGDAAGTGLPSEDTDTDKKQALRHSERSGNGSNVYHQREHHAKTIYELKQETVEGNKDIKKRMFGELGKRETAKTNDSSSYDKKHIDSKSLSPVKKSEGVAQISELQTASDPVSAHHFGLSEVNTRQGDCEPCDKASEQRSIRLENRRDSENGKPAERLNNVAEVPDTLQPPFESNFKSGSGPRSNSQSETRKAQMSSLSANNHTDRYSDSVSTLLLDTNDGVKNFSAPFVSTSAAEKSRRLPEHKTHAEISLRGSIEAPDPKADGYGPAKPSSIYKPGEYSKLKNMAINLEASETNKEPERDVTPRSLDVEEIHSSSKNGMERAEPRLIEPWEPPKQKPRIKIHLPFLQKETIVQFHPPDRHKYGPPKGLHSANVKLPTIGSHPPKHRGAAGTTEIPSQSGLRPPGHASTDGHMGTGYQLPSHLLPKEHRLKDHGPPQSQRDKFPGSVTDYQPPKHPDPETSYDPPVPLSPATEHHQPVQKEPVPEYQPSTVLSHLQQSPGAPSHLTSAAHDPLPHRRPASTRPKPSPRPAWLDVPREVLPVATPPATPTTLPYDPITELSFEPVKLTTPSPAYFHTEPIYPPLQPYQDTSSVGNGEEQPNYSQAAPSTAPHGSTYSPPVPSYVTPIPVRFSSTTPSSYVSLESNPSHASPRPTLSYAPTTPTPLLTPRKPTVSYVPPKPKPSYPPRKTNSSYALQKPVPSHAPLKPNPSYVPPKPTPSNTLSKPNLSYAPQKPYPSHSSPKDTPSYPPPNPTPLYVRPDHSSSYTAPAHAAPKPNLLSLAQAEVNYPLPGHPVPHPPVVLPPPAIRNYVVPSVDKLAERPLARAPAGSHVQGYVKPSHDGRSHIPPPPLKAHLPPPEQVEHPVRNYVASPEDRLVQKSQAPVTHTSEPVSVSHSIRNYVTPPGHELAQQPHVPVVHSAPSVSLGQPIRNYAASSEDRSIQKPLPVLALPPGQLGRNIRLFQPPVLRRDHADRRTVQEDTAISHTVVQQLRRPTDDYNADGAQQKPHIRPEEPELQGETGDNYSSSQQLPQTASSEDHRTQKPQEKTSIIDVLKAADSRQLLKLMELSGMRQLLEDTSTGQLEIRM